MDNRQQLLNECHEAFSATESARILTLYRSRDNRLSFDERLSITKEIEKVFYPVYLELRNINPSLTDWDLMLSVLSYEGFSVSVIAECFSVSNDAVRMRKSRLREKLPQEWFSLIFHTVTKMYQDQCHNSVTENVSGPEDAAILLASENQNQSAMEKNEPIKMTFGQAILKGLVGIVKFRGRASRAEFWYYSLFCLITQILLFAVFMMKDYISNLHVGYYMGLIILGISILLAISHCAVSVRRIQDTERNGWMWFGTYLTPWLILIVSFVWKVEYDVSLRNREPLPQLPDKFVMNWWTAIYIIDLVILLIVLIVTIIQYCRKGTEGPNIYGPDPLYRNNSKLK